MPHAQIRGHVLHPWHPGAASAGATGLQVSCASAWLGSIPCACAPPSWAVEHLEPSSLCRGAELGSQGSSTGLSFRLSHGVCSGGSYLPPALEELPGSHGPTAGLGGALLTRLLGSAWHSLSPTTPSRPFRWQQQWLTMTLCSSPLPAPYSPPCWLLSGGSMVQRSSSLASNHICVLP